MAITISQEPKRSRDGTEVFFVAIDNGMWFEFEATGSPIESKCRVDVYLADATKVNSNDIVLFFGIDNKVFFDASPYIQPYLNNDNDNTYQSAVETDVNASQGFYLKYGEYPVPSPDDVATSSTYYASKSAKQFGDTYGQNMASYWASSSQVVLAKLLTKQKTLPYWSGFPFSLSFIDSSYVDSANITQLDNGGSELSNVDYPALTDDTIEQVNILSINASARKLNVSLVHTPTFTFTVDTTKAGSASDAINLPYEALGTYSGVIDWGDGNTSVNSYANRNYTYPGGSGIYTIKITGTLLGWTFSNAGDKLKITDISEWGIFSPADTGFTFRGCTNLEITATDLPDFTGTTSLEGFFLSCPLIDTIPNVNSWDVSMITNFEFTFSTMALFNQDLNNWDLSNATTVKNMFRSSPLFNSSLAGWNLSSCTSFSAMFFGANSFNQPINDWTLNTTTGVSFNGMFEGASLTFNQPLGNWNTIKVTDMGSMFNLCTSFKQDLSNWDFRGLVGTSALSQFTSSDLNDPNSGDNTTNYNKLLVKLAADDVAHGLPVMVNAKFGTSHYDSTSGGVDGVTAHDYLTGQGWTITDGGTP